MPTSSIEKRLRNSFRIFGGKFYRLLRKGEKGCGRLRLFRAQCLGCGIEESTASRTGGLRKTAEKGGYSATRWSLIRWIQQGIGLPMIRKESRNASSNRVGNCDKAAVDEAKDWFAFLRNLDWEVSVKSPQSPSQKGKGY